ncbi:AraC family transcriptional regulator [Sorangium cellulosum]|uniref:AraC family transcriptional regulator n=1 Tax=Sorangium cellulosum TaxID=56 RepID=A0A150QG57_SORCE|nr:AraC family transcriptional regulator [Sorangium cellulosum]KYF66964.1 AraC family transcriptional regulator [Sorangium cellulosum]
MIAAAENAYIVRFRRVLEHIDAHLDEDLTLERLSGVAAFSKYHFQRQFSDLFGIGVHEYVKLVRLRRASYRLALPAREQARIIDIALASGYESPEAFSRAFKKAFGQTPSEFREQPRWDPWHATHLRLIETRTLPLQAVHRAEDVKILRFEETRVAAVEHRGDPKRILESVRQLIAWRKDNGLPPRTSATFNVLYDDPAETPPEAYRADICAGIRRPVSGNPFGVVEKAIPGGRCAVLRHVGCEDALYAAVKYLYATWLPASGEELRDFPLFLQRVRFFPEVPDHEAITDIFLPLQ